MEYFKSIGYKYNHRTRRYIIHTVATKVIISLTIKLLKSKGRLLFVKQKDNSFEINEFFLLELEYLLKLYIQDELNVSVLNNIIRIRDLLEFIQTKTWVSGRHDLPPEIDLSSITSRLKFKPMEHQLDAFKKYEYIKTMAGLRGIMLDSAAGTGKTYMSLALTEALHYDKCVIIVPKAVLNRVWEHSLKEELYKTSQTICLLGNGDKEYNGERFIITHYEYIDKMLSNNKLLRQLRAYKPNLIIDEFHNFNEITSQRTKNLLKLSNTVNFKDIFLLTGTPIKMTLTELLPMLYILDEKFPKVADVFVNFYKSVGNSIFQDLIRYRFDNYRKRIEKNDNILPPISVEEYRVSIPKNSDDYLIDTINQKVKVYKETRLKEIMSKIHIYEDTFNNLLSEAKVNFRQRHKSHSEKDVDIMFKDYRAKINVIHRAANNNTLQDIPDVTLFVNDFDKEVILPNIKDRHVFKDIRTIIKYPKYKVLGEALGKIILGSRIKCYNELANEINYKNLLKSTDKKVLIFSNYTTVCETVIKKTKNIGYSPLGVFGEHIPNLNSTVKQFTDMSSGINPLTATYKSLSTGVPITAANVILCIDVPFRSYLFDQAISRSHRIGQDKHVYVFLAKLDTNDKPNITDRDLYILNKSEANVKVITNNDVPYELPEQVDPSKMNIEEEEYVEDELTEEIIETAVMAVSNGYNISYITSVFESIRKKIKILS